ncbi:colicin D domain-containing protein [Amycolatopsis sp. cmx-4-68]|uniref:colicin D domain-containing protein n=1 Tax=Amycolatopsis sp. cmx-4-68 TaxID=2790938 RepID=UPI003977E683
MCAQSPSRSPRPPPRGPPRLRAPPPRQPKSPRSAPPALQKKFKHANDFGVDTSWSNDAAVEYEQALRRFAEDPANEVNASARYRDEPAILTPEQLESVVERGSLGGG